MNYQLPITEAGFPASGIDAEMLRFFVSFAILAPSSHNTQPWLFRIRERKLDLLADRSRALPVVDPADRALTISCGAALELLYNAARRFGRELAIEEIPGSDPNVLATARLGDPVIPTTDDLALFEAIPNRRTTRTEYDDRPLAVDLLAACRDLAAERGAELMTIDEASSGDRRSGCRRRPDTVQRSSVPP